MNSDLLERFIRQGRLKVVAPDGRETTYGDGTPYAAWRLNQPGAWRAMLRNPQLNLGETYMDGGWDITEGSLHDLLTILRRNIEANLGGSHWLNPLWALLGSWNNVAASRRNVSHHYDLDEALFRACLDADMHYSCAYFPQPGMSLEEAQAAKCRHIAAKLDLSAGQKVLDIGSGWGSLAMHLAERHDVTVTGLTLSAEQLRVAQERAQQRGLGNQVAFALQDYRQHNGEYDRVVSVGMFEHVGKRFYNTFFTKVAGFLTRNGVALLHTIGSKAPPTPVNPWIRRHIFPGGYIPSLSDIAPAVERSGAGHRRRGSAAGPLCANAAGLERAFPTQTQRLCAKQGRTVSAACGNSTWWPAKRLLKQPAWLSSNGCWASTTTPCPAPGIICIRLPKANPSAATAPGTYARQGRPGRQTPASELQRSWVGSCEGIP